MTERYLLFAGDRYYPGGGWKDFKMSFPSVELAVKAVKGLDDYDWWQVVDVETRTIVQSEDTSEQW
jgi:hypothetical protein